MEVIPFPPPNDNELFNRIHKVSGQIPRYGSSFEQELRKSEGENPDYYFLFPGNKGHEYFCWMLFCSYSGFDDEFIDVLLSQHRSRIQNGANSGQLLLTKEDKSYLNDCLRTNTGSKENIKAIRRWIADRAHSIYCIGDELMNFAKDQSFPSKLHTLYVINDVLYNYSELSVRGPYTEILDSLVEIKILEVLMKFAIPMIQDCYQAAINMEQKDKLKRLLKVWADKEFITTGKMVEVVNVLESQLPLEDPMRGVQLIRPDIGATLDVMEAEKKRAEAARVLGKPVPPQTISPPAPFYAAPHPATVQHIPKPPPPPPAVAQRPVTDLAHAAPQPPAPPQRPRTGPQPPAVVDNAFSSRSSAPPLPPTSYAPQPSSIDLHSMPVGQFADIWRDQLEHGHKRYSPARTADIQRSQGRIQLQRKEDPRQIEQKLEEFYETIGMKRKSTAAVL